MLHRTWHGSQFSVKKPPCSSYLGRPVTSTSLLSMSRCMFPSALVWQWQFCKKEMLLARNKVCWFSRETWSWFLERDITIEFFKCYFFGVLSATREVPFISVMLERTDVSAADIYKMFKWFYSSKCLSTTWSSTRKIHNTVLATQYKQKAEMTPL